jgi:hypothetical protein
LNHNGHDGHYGFFYSAASLFPQSAVRRARCVRCGSAVLLDALNLKKKTGLLSGGGFVYETG